jgi:NAD(P)H-dependent FMN reductase
MKRFSIPIILGSIRTGRASSRVAEFMKRRLRETGRVDTEVIDLREAALPMMEERLRFLPDPPARVVEFGETIARADAIVIVSPEYNGGYPGVLKNAIDYLLREYRRKPVGIVTVSSGTFGGIRVLEQLRDVMFATGAIPIPASLPVSRVQDLFEEDGSLKDASFEGRAGKFLDELFWYTEAISDMKEKERHDSA